MSKESFVVAFFFILSTWVRTNTNYLILLFFLHPDFIYRFSRPEKDFMGCTIVISTTSAIKIRC